MSRRHHYLFAHRELAAAAPRVGRRLLDDARRGEAEFTLRRVWAGIGGALPESERLDPEGLSASTHTIGDLDVVVVTMPTPMEQPEAYFGAMVVPRDEEAPIRYLTLEMSYDVVNRLPCTVGGEWNREGHLNLGEGPEPTIEAFLGWLELTLVYGVD